METLHFYLRKTHLTLIRFSMRKVHLLYHTGAYRIHWLIDLIKYGGSQ